MSHAYSDLVEIYFNVFTISLTVVTYLFAGIISMGFIGIPIMIISFLASRLYRKYINNKKDK